MVLSAAAAAAAMITIQWPRWLDGGATATVSKLPLLLLLYILLPVARK